MKKLILSALSLAFILPMSAQQLQNAGFEGTWGDCTPYTSGGNTKTSGTQPENWKISHVVGIGGLGATVVGENVEGYNSSKAVKLINTANPFRSSEIVPAFLTTGTPWSTSKASFNSVSNKDGGTFGGISFSKRPDALNFMYHRDQKSQDQPFTVVAYLWKGTTTQKDVPADITLMSAPKTVDMVNRDRNILGISTPEGGAVTKSDDFELIATINDNTHKGQVNDWTALTIPFDYKAESVPTMFNVIFAANNYFSSENITKDEALYVDDVKLVYYSQCTGLKISGTDFAGWNKDTYSYEATGALPSAEDVVCTLLGHAATAKVTADPEASTLTIVVTNADGTDLNGDSSHTYVIQYPKAAKGTTYNGFLDIEMGGQALATRQEASVEITKLSDTTCKFVLPNFTLAALGLTLGDIVIPVMNMEAAAGQTNYSGTVEHLMLMGGQLDADVKVKGFIKDSGEIDLKIDVIWHSDADIPIDVWFYTGAQRPTSVSDLAADAASEATYYDLTGRKVQNPGNGIYIKLQDGRATKVVL